MGFGGFGSIDGTQKIFMIIFFIIFFAVIGIMFFAGIKAIIQWNKNNHSPRLTVPASVVSRRTNVSSHRHSSDSMMHGTHHTTYFVTFEVESGDRMELQMGGREYGLLAEGDVGMLTFQGTRYLGFERDRRS
ncbi:MAG: DUF2500 domain-containing protein [Clostridia bacterium]|nr:DUF2500 domain-containing protein [Clostridia bacterium]